MFILFVMMLAASLAAYAGHLFTVLTLQHQTVNTTLISFKYDQLCQGALAYAIAQLAHSSYLQEKILRDRQVVVACDLFNTVTDGYTAAKIVYTLLPEGYLIQVALSASGKIVQHIRARVVREKVSEKVIYSCVAIEAF